MIIGSHPVDRYIERVLGLKPHQVGDNVRDYARRQIEKAVEDPEQVYDEKEGFCPVYIRKEVAVPCDEGTVPTVYAAQTFNKKIEEQTTTHVQKLSS